MSQTLFNFICTCALLLAPLSGQAAIILYTAEGDTGTSVTDSLTSDGSQDGSVYNAVGASSTEAAFGSKSYQFGNQTDVANNTKIALNGTASQDLGSSFTLAAAVNVRAGGGSDANRFTRLFTSFGGSGSTVAPFMYYDFNFNTGAYRFAFHGNTTVTGTLGTRSAGTWHHFAVTYDNGAAVMYFDGVSMATGTDLTPASTTLNTAGLWFGEDYGDTTDPGNSVGTGAETLDGYADDILVYNEAMNLTQIQNLAANGALSVVPEPSAFMLVAGTLLAAIMLNTRRKKC